MKELIEFLENQMKVVAEMANTFRDKVPTGMPEAYSLACHYSGRHIAYSDALREVRATQHKLQTALKDVLGE